MGTVSVEYCAICGQMTGDLSLHMHTAHPSPIQQYMQTLAKDPVRQYVVYDLVETRERLRTPYLAYREACRYLAADHTTVRDRQHALRVRDAFEGALRTGAFDDLFPEEA